MHEICTIAEAEVEIMDPMHFKASLDGEAPREGVSPSLRALWRRAKGDWDEAHQLAQAQDDEAGAWVHGLRHRVEGVSAAIDSKRDSS